MDDTQDPGAPPPIGARIHAIRQERSWSLQDLADRSGVSRAMLSKIERAETSPTIALAARIAGALGIGLSHLIQQPGDRVRARIIRSDERQRFEDPKTGFVRELISPPFENRRFELVQHVLPKGKSTGTLPAYPPGTEKQVVVEKGGLTVSFAGESHVLEIGDGLFFEADVPHEFANSGRGECRYYLVVAMAPSRS